MPAEYLPAFTDDEVARLHALMAAQVIPMRGRKLEEGDWTAVYCAAKGIEYRGWSNLDIDVIHTSGLGVEHKMLGTGATRPEDMYGKRLMHPAMTRSIRIPDSDDPGEVMVGILEQYGELVIERAENVQRETGKTPDLRLGWLLWQTDLSQFLYFEERMAIPDPAQYYAEWNEIKRTGRRKSSRNLWIFERETGIKRYSITTTAGAKIQPYFDVPPRDSPYAYLITVEGEEVEAGQIRLWVGDDTYRRLVDFAGGDDPGALTDLILEGAAQVESAVEEGQVPTEPAREILVSRDAYEALTTALTGTNADERLRRLLNLMREERG